MKKISNYTSVEISSETADKLHDLIPANMRRRIATSGVETAIDIWIARHNPVPVVYPENQSVTS